jgi:hypothetical protein
MAGWLGCLPEVSLGDPVAGGARLAEEPAAASSMITGIGGLRSQPSDSPDHENLAIVATLHSVRLVFGRP